MSKTVYEMKKSYTLELRKKLRNIKKKSYGDPLIRGEGKPDVHTKYTNQMKSICKSSLRYVFD